MAQTQSNSAADTRRAKAAPRAQSAAKSKAVALDYFAPEANTVAVAGDFNNWDMQAHMLKQSKAGWWKTNLKLAPGQYQYRFVVDGQQWSDDPENPNKVPNEFASFNSVLEVH